jgi:PAS domain S-box-containing protein
MTLLRILHVEDDPIDADLLVETLRAGGVECEAVRVDTESSFAFHLESGEFDLILSDFSLPAFSGTRALELARARRPEVPFIVVSGTIGEDAAIQSLTGGATDYVLKHKFSRLLPAVQRACQEAGERARRRETEAALRESEKKYRTLFEESKDAILILTPDGRFTDINPAGVSLLGYSSREEVLRVVHEPDLYVDPDHVRERRRLIEALGYVRDLEIELRQRDGTVLTVLETGTPELDGLGETRTYRGIWRDVTEQRSVEAQLLRAQRLESIGMLASGIAHDLNNVFTPILMTAELLLGRSDAAGRERPTLEALQQSARRGSELVKQILTFARGGDDRRQDVHLGYLIKDVEKVFTATFPASIRVRTDVSPDLWPVHGSDTQLHQILMNLGVNARDAMSSGGLLTIGARNVHLSSERESHGLRCGPGPSVLVEVADTGGGISERVQADIFKAFFTTKRAEEGTGLGLSTVQTVLRNHGGIIEVSSSVGRGTTFTIHLPASVPESQRVLTQPEPSPRGRGELVLIIDDDSSVCDMMRATLEAHGYRALTATGGDDGLRIFLQYRSEIRIVIAEIDDPSVTGPTLAATIRETNPETSVIWTTALGLEGDDVLPSDGTRVGTVVRKPFTTKALLDALGGTTRPT